MAAPPLPDWSELHRDPLELIIRSLEIQDALSAAAVCTNWRAAGAAALGRALAPNRVAWLLIHDYVYAESSSDDTIGAVLHDISSGRSYRTTIPDSCMTGIIGSSRGWFVVCEYLQPRLLNPFTGSEISLPRVPDLPSSFHYRRAILSGDPSGGCYSVMLMVSFSRDRDIGLFSQKKGDMDLYMLSGDHEWWPFKGAGKLQDCIPYRGRFLTVDEGGQICQWDIHSKPEHNSSLKATVIFDAPVEKSLGFVDANYLLSAPWGDLLLVQKRDGSEFMDHYYDPTTFTIFRVDLLKRSLEKMTGLRGHTMIWGQRNRSLISVELHPTLPPDCILFFDPHITVRVSDGNGYYGLRTAMYDLKSQVLLPHLPPSLESALFSDRNSMWMWIISPSCGDYNSSSTNGRPIISSSKADKLAQEDERNNQGQKGEMDAASSVHQDQGESSGHSRIG